MAKPNLEKSIPRKLKAWREPNARFVIMRDNDGGDCVRLKNKLMTLCSDCGKTDVLIRIVCQELESWYLGDLNALIAAYPDLSMRKKALVKKCAHPDQLTKPSVLLTKLLPEFQKIAGARVMAQHLNVNKNCSKSFLVFVDGVRRIVNEMSE